MNNLLHIPVELLAEIATYLTITEILRIRQTSVYLSEATSCRSIWVDLYHTYAATVPSIAHLEIPLDECSSSELEEWVSRRVSVNMGWRSSRVPLQRNLFTQPSYLPNALSPGGRWLFRGGVDGMVLAWDLSQPRSPPFKLAQVSSGREIDFMSLSSHEKHFPDTFFMHLGDGEAQGVNFSSWEIKRCGRGSESTLDVVQIKELRFDELELRNCVFHSHYLARLSPMIPPRCVEIIDWLASTSDALVHSFVFAAQPILRFVLLPKNKLLAIHSYFMDFYDIPSFSNGPTPSDRTPPAIPIRRLVFNHPQTTIGYAPPPSPTYILSTHSRIVIQAREAIYGVHIPPTGVEKASACKLFNLRGQPSPLAHVFGLGVAFSVNRTHAEPRKLAYVWPGDEIDMIADPSSNATSINANASSNMNEINEGGGVQRREWAEPAWPGAKVVIDHILAFDEWSGRMVLRIKDQCLVVDFASYRGLEVN